jgi:hypothetical protein
MKIASPTLFPTWRKTWCEHSDMDKLFREAEEPFKRRKKGNQKFPILSGLAFAQADDATAEMLLWADGKFSPTEVGPSGEVAQLIYRKAWPLLRAAAWPRWLLLEQAFHDASDAGDLHFSAITLRTMCEEIERQNLLDLDQSQFVSLAQSDFATDRELFLIIVKSACANLAALSQNDIDLPVVDSRSEKIARDTELNKARISLNDYVHPNYGSHVVALYPERPTAARILLNAVAVTYRAFFDLSWSEQPLKGDSRPTPVQDLSWPRAARDVVSRALPAARDLVQTLEIPNALDWLTRHHNGATKDLLSPEAIKLLNTLPMAAKTGDQTIAENTRWAGATPNALLNLALARRSESVLTRHFPNGAPPAQETDRWFVFLSRAIELILLVNEVRETSFKMQLVKQLAQRNPLAIELCVRSLIEHRATVAILPVKLTKHWLEAAKRFQPGGNIPSSILSMDSTITKLLAGRRDSAEPLLPFATREDNAPITSISLPTLVKEAFNKSNDICRLYHFSSAAIHGRILRGKEFLKDRSGREAGRSCLTGLIILDWICSTEVAKDYLYPAFQIMMNAKHAALQSGRVGTDDRRKAQQMMGNYDGNFKLGKDYVGDGSKSSPIEFKEHILYYPAAAHLLEKMKMESTSIPTLDHDDNGRLCDRYVGQDRDLWFLIPGNYLWSLMGEMEIEDVPRA